MWQNSNTQTMMKLLKTQNVENSRCDSSKTQNVAELKKPDCDKTQKLKM